MTDADDLTTFNSSFADGFEQRLAGTLGHSQQLAQKLAARRTPTPQVGDMWRVRWRDSAGVALVTHLEERHATDELAAGAPDAIDALRVAPISIDSDPDDSAVLAPASTHDLGFNVAVWVGDEAEVPACVLECKVGEFSVPGIDGLPRGTRNWGPSDPRTVTRAHLQDLLDELTDASWAPPSTTATSLPDLLATADIREVAAVLGSSQLAMQLRRGQTTLTAEQAERLAPVLSTTPEELLAASPPLPEDLVTLMNQPSVRSLVDRIAARNHADEVATWRTAAYGVYALAAREHSRSESTNWAGRLRAYFDAVLNEPPARDGSPDSSSGQGPW